MSEGAAAPAPNGAPQSPAGVTQPTAAPAQPARRRLSDMEMGLEQHNARAQEPKPAPRQPREPDAARYQPDPDAEPELPALPTAESELDAAAPEEDVELPSLPADPNAMQAKDKELLDATKAWLEGGETPEAIKNAIHEWTDKTTGAPRRMTIAQMEEGVLRQSDYQRNMNELRGYHQQVQFREQANNQFWQNAREPEKLLEELEDRGYDEVFEKAAITFATRRANMKRLAEAAGYAVMQQYGLPAGHPDVVTAVRDAMRQQTQNRKIEIENRKLQKHNEMLAQVRQQQDGQAQRQQRVQALNQSIQPLIPAAFKQAGVRNTATNQEAFWKHLAAHVSSQPGWDGNVRRQHCTAAAQMVREELEDLAHARSPKKPVPQSRAMPPSRLGSSGAAQPTTPERKRVSDMGNDGRFGFG